MNLLTRQLLVCLGAAHVLGEFVFQSDRMEAEYIIIGTMMSFGCGLLVAYGATYLLALDWV